MKHLLVGSDGLPVRLGLPSTDVHLGEVVVVANFPTQRPHRVGVMISHDRPLVEL